MSKRWMLVGAVAMALTIMSASSVRAKDEEKSKEESEVKMALKDVPAAVQATLVREAAGQSIKAVDKETKDGKTIYEVDVVIDGTNYEIVVGSDGRLISKKVDKEEDEKAGEKKEKEKKD